LWNGLDHSEKENLVYIITERSRPFPTIQKIMGLYKSGVSKNIHLINEKIEVWQKSYYEHIIRNEQDYKEIYEYIENNPLKWELDKYFNLS